MSLDEHLVTLGFPVHRYGVRATPAGADGRVLRVSSQQSVPSGLGSLLNAGAHEWAGPGGARLDFGGVRYHVERPDSSEADLEEHEDRDEVVRRKVAVLARLVRERAPGSEFVVYTGAGISTAAKIPDFRGPQGCWTRRDRGEAPPPSVPMEQAVPTYSHACLVEMLRAGACDYLVSQNVDGLHRRSGVPAASLSELHGNCFLERCAGCGADYMRTYNVRRRLGPHFGGVRDARSQSGISHITGRACGRCGGGMLRDSIVHFGENLPEDDLARADQHSRRAAVALCAGTSLRVTPAADLPGQCREAGGVMVVANLQRTARDLEALRSGGFVVHARCDRVFELLARGLGLRGLDNTKARAEAYAETFRRQMLAEAAAGAGAGGEPGGRA